VAHVVLACSDLGLSIGPLHPVEIQHVNLEKPQYLPTPSLPAYGTPSDSSQQGADHLTLSFDISVDLKCNSGSDGLVTVSLPPPIPSTPSASPSPQAPGPENGGSEGENGNEDNTTASAPAEQTQAPADPIDPSATSSCPPDSAPSNVQDPSDAPAPPQSTEPEGPIDPAVTSAPSPTSPDEGDPESPASTSSCSTASENTGGPDAEDPSQSDPSPSPTNETSDLPNDGGEPEVPVTSNAEALTASAPPTPAPPSSTCSTTDDTEMSSDPIPGSQLPQTAEPTTAAQPSPLPCPSSPPAPTSLTEQEPLSTIHRVPPPLPSPPPYQTADESNVSPPEYAPSGLGERSSGEGSAFETSLPESNTEQVPQENHSPEVDAPSYGQGSLTPPALTPTPASQTDALAVETADGKPTSKTAEPSVVTLWPTANRTSCTTGSVGRGGLSTTTCEPDGKRTVATASNQNGHVPVTQSGIGNRFMAGSMVDSGHHDVISGSLATQARFAASTSKPDTSSIQPNDTATGPSLPRVALTNSDSKLTPYLCTMMLLVILISGTLMS
jgi:hypothetical protein